MSEVFWMKCRAATEPTSVAAVESYSSARPNYLARPSSTNQFGPAARLTDFRLPTYVQRPLKPGIFPFPERSGVARGNG